ncbi:MAG: porin family protein [Bacteroidales bacterium]
MKKSIILITISLLLIFITHTPCEARKLQERNTPCFGIKGGVNFSNLYTKDASNAKMLTGFNLGMFGKLPITKHIAVQPELYFTTKGAEVAYNSLFVNGTARFHLNYVEVPLLIVVNITDNFNIQVGPYGSYMISGIVKNESNINLFNFEQNIDTHDYNRFDAGIAVGAGIDIGAISLGARYYYGLTNVGKERTFLGISYTVPDANNGVFNVYISISLN